MATSIKIKDNMCLGCPCHCCKITAELTSYDIVRIILAENIKMADFVGCVQAKENAFGFNALGRKMEFALKHRDGRCIFFRDEGPLHCSIEASKPGVCLSYPFSFCNGRAAVRTDPLCPPENRKKMDKAKMSADILESNDWEWHEYCEIIEDWNMISKGNEAPEQFIKFACREMELRTSLLDIFRRKIRRLNYQLFKK